MKLWVKVHLRYQILIKNANKPIDSILNDLMIVIILKELILFISILKFIQCAKGSQISIEALMYHKNQVTIRKVFKIISLIQVQKIIVHNHSKKII